MSGNSTLLKGLLIVLSLFIIGCMGGKKQEHGAVYDEAALKTFVLASAQSDRNESLAAMDTLLAGAAKDSLVFCQTLAFLEEPFGNPNSAYRSDDFYAALLETKMKSGWIDSTTKARTREQLYLLMQNRVGSAANDFTYLTPAGSKKKMYAIDAPFLLLYFNNPGCTACKQMREALDASTIIREKIKAGQLKVLSIYTDKDSTAWLNHLPEMPAAWIHGRDEDEHLHKNSVYDLRAIPTLYLLDENKTVLLKDCLDLEKIEMQLRQ